MDEKEATFVPEVDSWFVGMVMAYHARRLTARNMMAQYATTLGVAPQFNVGPAADLLHLYKNMLWLEEAMQTSEELFEVIALKKIQAQGLVERVRTGDLDEPTATESVRQAYILMEEIEHLAEIMEGMSGA